jgi:hypothetical protein
MVVTPSSATSMNATAVASQTCTSLLVGAYYWNFAILSVVTETITKVESFSRGDIPARRSLA